MNAVMPMNMNEWPSVFVTAPPVAPTPVHESALGSVDPVPGDRESAERVLIDGLDLAAKTRERTAA